MTGTDWVTRPELEKILNCEIDDFKVHERIYVCVIFVFAISIENCLKNSITVWFQ